MVGLIIGLVIGSLLLSIAIFACVKCKKKEETSEKSETGYNKGMGESDKDMEDF